MRRLNPADEELREIARAKLASSGLGDEHAQQLKIATLDKKQMAALGPEFDPRGGLKIPYFDLDGKPTKFFRVRYLEAPIGFAANEAKPLRYMQPRGTAPEAYLPPLFDWDALARGVDRLYITEGELKSACAGLRKIPTIGLGGVDSWRSKKRGWKMLPIFEKFDWTAREVVIVYDSDAATNKDVLRAQQQLAQELSDRRACVKILSLPPGPKGAKQGLDDWLVTHSDEEWATLALTAHDYELGKALWDLNSTVVFVRDPGLLIEQDKGTRLSAQNFVKVHYANRRHTETVKKESRIISTAQRWMEWPARYEVERIVYEPGQPKVYEEAPQRRVWNNWEGWGCVPVRGDMGWWRSVVHDLLFKGHSAELKWFEQWLAYPLQHPGAKLLTAALLWGRSKGVGKSFIGAMMRGIYGKNGLELKEKDIHGSFNGMLENKQFVQGEEVTNRDRRSDAEFFKNLVSQQTLMINAKFVPHFSIRDCINWLFTSNFPDAFFLDEGDRRFFVHEVKTRPEEIPLGTWPLWDRKRADGTGPAELFHYLLHLDLSGFNPNAPALMTAAKQAMIHDSQSDIAAWCVQLRDDPDHVLAGTALPTTCDIFTPKNLCVAYDPDDKRRIGAPGMGRALKIAGLSPVHNGPVRTAAHGTVRLYAVRNRERWTNARLKDIASHYDQHFPAVGPKRFD